MPAKPIGKIESLALAVAGGATVRAWCKAHGIGETTAYRWSGSDEFKARVKQIQAEIVKRALAKLTGTSPRAVMTLKKLMKSESDKVACSAATNLLKLLMDMQSHAELNERLATVERRLDNDAGKPQ